MNAPWVMVAVLGSTGWATVFWNLHCDNRERNRLLDEAARADEMSRDLQDCVRIWQERACQAETQVAELKQRHSRKPEVLAGDREKRAKVVDALKSGTAVVS